MKSDQDTEGGLIFSSPPLSKPCGGLGHTHNVI